MTTLTLTLKGNKNELNYFTIEFNILNFDLVIESIASIKNYEELVASNLWTIK